MVTAYLPIKLNELDKLYNNKKTIKKINLRSSFGVHWFNGAEKSNVFQNNLNLENITSNCFMNKLILSTTTITNKNG